MREKLVVILTTVISIGVALSSLSIGADLEIKQEGYLFKSGLTEHVYAETFVISPVPDKEGGGYVIVTDPECTRKSREKS